MDGVDSTKTYNVHTIAIEVPISEVTRYGNRPTDPMAPGAVIGVWATASRRKSRILNAKTGKTEGHGPWQQVSRLGSPLFNEVIVPMAEKDKWNVDAPSGDKAYAKYVNRPELAALLPVLYPGVFPNLAKYTKPRADLNAILLTGIPSGVVPGFQNYTGPVESDMLRLNVAVPPTPMDRANPLGLVAGDAAGYPNGRRVVDDTTTIQLRAIAGLTIPLVDKSFTPDGATSKVTDGTTNENPAYKDHFPFLGAPNGGYETSRATTSASPTTTTRTSTRRTPSRDRARSCSTSGTTSGRSSSRCRPRWWASRSRSGPSAPTSTATTRTSRWWPGRSGTDLVPSLVYGDLTEGSYELYEKGGGPVRLTVAVAGGSVAEAEWP